MTRARDVANLIGSGNYSSTTFTATAGQTAFTISHTQGFVQVFMNGLLLDETVDYTSNGSAVTLTSGAAAGDEIEVVAYNTFSVGDALNQAAADTRYVNASGDTMTGNLGIGAAPTSALSIEGSGFTDSTIRLKRTASGTNNDAGLQFTSAAGANSGYGMGGIWFKNSLDDNAYALIRARTDDSTGTSGRLDFITSDAAVGNTTASRLTIDSSGRVTTPYQPHIYGSVGNTGGTGSGGAGVCNRMYVQTSGGGMTFSNSRITVPVAGVYMVSWQTLTHQAGSGRYDTNVRLNGSDISNGLNNASDQTNDYRMRTHIFARDLAANDYLQFYHANPYASGAAFDPWAIVSVFLLG